MSAAAQGHAHGHEALAQANRDPTRSATLRRRYAAKLRGGFADINTQIRRGVRDRDVFGLRGEGLAEPLPIAFPRREDKQIETFDAWLKRQQQNDVLTVINRNGNTYVRSAYGKGLRHATTQLRSAGVDVPEEDLERIFNRPVHRDTLQLLYTSDYSDLEGITAEVSKQANRILTSGFAAGKGPAAIARELTDVVDDIGKRRATTLARTSVIDAHAEATLNRYERFTDELDGVTIKAEWSTAGDNKVCAICQALEGKTWTIEEARSKTVTAAGVEDVPIKPPAHPNCRCSILPVTS